MQISRFRRSAAGSSDDAGFSLLEVVVAMSVLAIVSVAALSLGVSGMKDSATLSERQTAVTLAVQALEQARAVDPARGSTGVSRLVVGRTPAAVAAQWASLTSPDQALTWPASDPAVPAPAAVLPLSVTQTLAGRTYTVDTLVGTCYRLRATTASSTCEKRPLSSGLEPPASASLVQLLRVTAVVRWTPADGSSCPTGGCTYSTSALVDPGDDLTWNRGADLVATDDAASVRPGTTTTINVLANDTGSFSPTNPVTITSTATAGTATADSSGVVTVTAPHAGPATVTFSYTVTGSSGSVSNTATVTITVSAS